MIIAVLPAYNAEKTLKRTLDDIPRDVVDKIILVDDCSRDNTVALAKSLGLETYVHEKNLGYGGNQKTCYDMALKYNPDIVVMVHPDHQYAPEYIHDIIVPLKQKRCDAVFGSRMMVPGDAILGGMPQWKYWANKFLTFIENKILHTNLTEFHSGFRAYSAHLLRTVDYHNNSNNFVFDTEIIIQILHQGLKIKEVPIPTRYFKEASSVGFKSGVRYGLDILRALYRYKFKGQYR